MYQITNNTRQLNLEEFPGYRCYLLRFAEKVSEENLPKQKIDDIPGYRNYTYEYYNLIPDGKDCYSSLWKDCTKGKLVEGDRLMLHQKCDIPSTAIKKYETVSSVSKDVPTKYVVPLRDNDGGRHIYSKAEDGFVVFVNNYRHIVLLMCNSWFCPESDRSYDTDLFMRTLNQELYDADGFELLDGCVKYYQAVKFVDKTDYALFNGMIPPELIINEADIPVGDGPVTKELILNSYKLLQSRDQQIQDTALITLAQHDCSGYEELLGWLFYHMADNRYILKARNSAFRWLMIRVEKFGKYSTYSSTFHQLDSIKAGRWLVRQLTDGKVYWNEENTMCIDDKSIISRQISQLIKHLP